MASAHHRRVQREIADGTRHLISRLTGIEVVDGRADGCVNGCADGYVNGCVDERVNGRVDVRYDVRVELCTW